MCWIGRHDRRRRLQKAAGCKRHGLRFKSIRRRLEFIAGRKVRLRKDIDPSIAKSLMAKVKDSGGGIALEDWQGSRNRTGFRRQQ